MDTLLAPLYAVVSWILVAFHAVLGPVFGRDVGWTLSIVGLVIVIRILLIPLFVKQIKSQRAMQVLAPRMKEIQAKYKDRERQSQELMKLYKETGTNPMSSCLPIIAQSPVFLALYRVLAGIAATPRTGHGAFASNPTLLADAAQAKLVGAPISDTLRTANSTHTTVVAVVLIVLMVASQFLTQRQLIMKNLPESAQQNNQMLQQQKMMMYIFPLIFAFVGINFPIGILIYWFTSNLWSMGQQFYVIHRMPTPGSKAEEALRRRQAARATKRGGLGGLLGRGQAAASQAPAGARSPDTSPTQPPGTVPSRQAGQRRQPSRQPKAKRSGTPRKR